METSDLLSLLIAAYKDKVERDSFERITAELNTLIVADADARRAATAADIKEMAKLKIALSRFEITYGRIKDSVGKIDAIDDYVAKIQRRIKEISYKKNR